MIFVTFHQGKVNKKKIASQKLSFLKYGMTPYQDDSPEFQALRRLMALPAKQHQWVDSTNSNKHAARFYADVLHLSTL